MSAPPLDLLPPGQSSVRHELVLQVAPGLEDHRWLAGPTRGRGGVLDVGDGRPFPFSSKYGTRVFAVPPGVELPQDEPGDREVLEWLGQYPSAGPFREVTSVPLGRSLAHVVTTYRVVAVEDETLHVEVVDEQLFDTHGNALDGPAVTGLLLLLAVVGALGLAALARSSFGLPDDGVAR